MKRPIAILFLLLFLFNLIGYYGVYFGMQLSAKKELRQRLDAEAYDEEETITVKIPFTLPYQTDWESFQRIDGSFEKNGQAYNLVKQKVESDTLIVVYIKDKKATSLLESLTDFVHAHTDSPLSKKASQLIKAFAKDYIGTQSELQASSSGWSIDDTMTQLYFAAGCFSENIASPPPRG